MKERKEGRKEKRKKERDKGRTLFMLPNIMVLTCDPALRRLRQEDGHGFKSHPGYVVCIKTNFERKFLILLNLLSSSLKLYIYSCFIIHICIYANIWRSKVRRQLLGVIPLLPHGIPGVKLRSSGLAVSAFTLWATVLRSGPLPFFPSQYYNNNSASSIFLTKFILLLGM